MIECKRDRESIAAYVDGALETSARAELESHLETCAACRELVAAGRRLAEVFAALPEVTPPGDFEARFWARIARERDAAPLGYGARLREFFSMRRALALGSATAAALALLIALSRAPSTPTAKADPDVRIVTNAEDFELLQDPDMDAIADVDVLEAWDDASPS
jgi:anti-sigma factor RsiW